MSITPSVETIMKKTNFAFTASFVGVSGYPCDVGAFTASHLVEHEGSFWSLRLYPGGIDEESKGYMSIMISYESRGKARAGFKITVLNQKGWKDFQSQSDHVVEFVNYPEMGDLVIHGDPRSMARSNIKNPTNGICVDDKLLIKIELTVFGEVERVVRAAGISSMLGSPPKKSSILDDLGNILFDATSADVTILCSNNDTWHSSSADNRNSKISDSGFATTAASAAVDNSFSGNAGSAREDMNRPTLTDNDDYIDNGGGGKLSHLDTSSALSLTEACISIPAHRFVLCLRSPVFRAMLTGSLYEANTREIEITDFPAEVIRAFLSYMYTDNCDSETMETYGELLLAAAYKYHVTGLETLCENHLCSTLSVENVLNVLYLADLYEAKRLKNRALQYIGCHAKEVVQYGSSNVNASASSTPAGGSSSGGGGGGAGTGSIFQALRFGLCQEVMQVLAGMHPMSVVRFGSGDAADDGGYGTIASTSSRSNFGTPDKSGTPGGASGAPSSGIVARTTYGHAVTTNNYSHSSSGTGSSSSSNSSSSSRGTGGGGGNAGMSHVSSTPHSVRSHSRSSTAPASPQQSHPPSPNPSSAKSNSLAPSSQGVVMTTTTPSTVAGPTVVSTSSFVSPVSTTTTAAAATAVPTTVVTPSNFSPMQVTATTVTQSSSVLPSFPEELISESPVSRQTVTGAAAAASTGAASATDDAANMPSPLVVSSSPQQQRSSQVKQQEDNISSTGNSVTTAAVAVTAAGALGVGSAGTANTATATTSTVSNDTGTATAAALLAPMRMSPAPLSTL